MSIDTFGGSSVNCVWGTPFEVDHLLYCSCGGIPSFHLNEIGDVTAKSLMKVCNGIQIEPDMQETTTETMTMRGQDWTLQPVAYLEGDVKGCSWMLGCSIHLHPEIGR